MEKYQAIIKMMDDSYLITNIKKRKINDLLRTIKETNTAKEVSLYHKANKEVVYELILHETYGKMGFLK